MENFDNFMIPDWLKSSLGKMNYSTPTPIQAQTIPTIIEGRDLLGTAQTGTGKTGAFLIPLLTYLYNNKTAKALVLTPTRELATQVHSVVVQMIKNTNFVKTALLIGGDSMSRQFMDLKANPRLIVGTPGRINDHLHRKSLNLEKASFVVLDETDRMLDMGFGIQIDEIFSYMPKKKQVLLFSATMPKEIEKLVDNYLVDPLKVSVGEVNRIASKVTQEIVCTSDKYSALLEFLQQNTGSSIIFVKTQRMVEMLADKLTEAEFQVGMLHGGLKQSRRTYVTKSFRQKKFNILVATDVASRGLDIVHLENVINYDIPHNPEDYVHRIGRTARAEKNGKAITFIVNSEKQEWNRIQKFIGKTDLLFEIQSTKGSTKKPLHRNKTSSGKFEHRKKSFEGGNHSGQPSFYKKKETGFHERSSNTFGGNKNNNRNFNASTEDKRYKLNDENSHGNQDGNHNRRAASHLKASSHQGNNRTRYQHDNDFNPTVLTSHSIEGAKQNRFSKGPRKDFSEGKPYYGNKTESSKFPSRGGSRPPLKNNKPHYKTKKLDNTNKA